MVVRGARAGWVGAVSAATMLHRIGPAAAVLMSLRRNYAGLFSTLLLPS